MSLRCGPEKIALQKFLLVFCYHFAIKIFDFHISTAWVYLLGPSQTHSPAEFEKREHAA
jgi:hypothetical protein